MMHRLFVAPLVIAALALPAFSGQQKQQASNPSQQVSTTVEPPPVLSVPPGYKYDSHGRRDPFVNPIPKPVEQEKAAVPAVRPPGLKGLLVGDAKILGVVTSREAAMNKAIIQAPGNRTYFAALGDTLFDAVIKDIQPDAVVFMTMSTGKPNGQQPVNQEIVRKVRPATGENK